MDQNLVQVVSEIIAATGSVDAVRRAALAAGSVIPSLAVVHGSIELESGAVSFISSNPAVITRQRCEKLAASAAEHPLIAYALNGNGNSDNVIAISDLMTAGQFKALKIYEDCYDGTEIVDELRAPIPAEPASTAALIFCRAESGFSELEREYARMIATVVAGCEGPSREIEALTEGVFTEARLREFGLTVREAEIFSLLAEGRRSQQVAYQLGISVRTVEKHTQAIYRQLGVSSRSEAMAKLIRRSQQPS